MTIEISALGSHRQRRGISTARLMRYCRLAHGWLGVFILPWVIMIGFTGFYLNHSSMIEGALGSSEYDDRQMEIYRRSSPLEIRQALRLGKRLLPGARIAETAREPYHQWDALHIKTDQGKVIIALPTAHYYLKQGYTRLTYTPDGTLAHRKIYWGALFSEMHETGWLGGKLGTWLADILSFCLIGFGLTGLAMWAVPRIRRRKA